MSTVAEPAYRQRIAYHATLLGGFATLAATLLLLGNLSTRAPIEKRLAEDMLASLSQVIPPGVHDNNLLDDVMIFSDKAEDALKVYQAKKGNSVTAVAFGITAQGYAGDIKMVLGIGRDGNILGVRVLTHAETPGLGDRIEVKKSDWILGFNGLSLNNTPASHWHVKKDGGRFDQFSGATITPRGVVKAIKEGLDFFTANKSVLLNAAQTETKEAE